MVLNTQHLTKECNYRCKTVHHVTRPIYLFLCVVMWFIWCSSWVRRLSWCKVNLRMLHTVLMAVPLLCASPCHSFIHSFSQSVSQSVSQSFLQYKYCNFSLHDMSLLIPARRLYKLINHSDKYFGCVVYVKSIYRLRSVLNYGKGDDNRGIIYNTSVQTTPGTVASCS